VTIFNAESGEQLSSVVGPFSEGASFSLRCDVSGGKLFPKFLSANLSVK